MLNLVKVLQQHLQRNPYPPQQDRRMCLVLQSELSTGSPLFILGERSGAFCKYPHDVICDCPDTNKKYMNINQLDGNDSISDSFYATDEDESLDDSNDSPNESYSEYEERYIEVIANIPFMHKTLIDDCPPW